MSETEMKLQIIKKIATLEDEKVLKAVYDMLAATPNTEETVNLSKHYDAIKEQYGDVLRKLAQ